MDVPDDPRTHSRQGDLKLFGLKTMWPPVTLSDRTESVVAHPDCDQCPGEGSCHGFTALRITGRVVLGRGE